MFSTGIIITHMYISLIDIIVLIALLPWNLQL